MARGLGFYCNFDTLSPLPESTGRAFCQDKITGVTAVAGATTTTSGSNFNLGVSALVTTAGADGFNFGTGSFGVPGTLTDIAYWTNNANPFTVCAKARVINTAAADRRLVVMNAGGTDNWELDMNSSGFYKFVPGDSGPALAVSAVDGKWYTVFATYAPGNLGFIALYDTNGVLIDSASGATASPTQGINPIAIGHGTDGTNPFDGEIEWCAIWKRVLTSTEMAALAVDPYQILLQPTPRPMRLAFKTPAGGITPGVMSGVSSITINSIGSLNAIGSLSGASSMTVNTVGTVTGKGTLSGASSLTINSSGNATAKGNLSGASSTTINSTSSIAGGANISGSSSLTINSAGSATAQGNLSGASSLTVNSRGSGTATGNLGGESSITINSNGLMPVAITATVTLTAGPASVAAIATVQNPSQGMGYSGGAPIEAYREMLRQMREQSKREEFIKLHAITARVECRAGRASARAKAEQGYTQEESFLIGLILNE